MRGMRQSEIDDLFGDHRFKDERIEHLFTSTMSHNGLLRLVVVVIPMDEITHYRVDKGNDTMLITSDFKFAFRTFRELIR